MGHLGVARTYANLFENYFWPRCLTDIRKYVQSCPSCQRKRNPREKPSGFLQPIPVVAAFYTVGIDYLGPFITSKKRNKYLIVAIDHFSKWVECRPVRASTAANAAHFFIEQIVNRFGAPKCVLSDRGTHFTAAFFRNRLQLYGTTHNCTASYNPQANGLTERMNQTLSYVMSHYVRPDMRDWDECVST